MQKYLNVFVNSPHKILHNQKYHPKKGVLSLMLQGGQTIPNYVSYEGKMQKVKKRKGKQIYKINLTYAKFTYLNVHREHK